MASNHEYVLILEDDVWFHSGLQEIWTKRGTKLFGRGMKEQI